ncbi:MAG: M56 family metallopeptidase [Gemmataceae bacterium]
MNTLGIQATEWLTHTAVAGGIVLGLGWILSRNAAPTAARTVAGWSVRGAVLAAVLCLLPGWITLPAPQWTNPPSAAPSTVVPDGPIETPLSSDVAQVHSGEWVLVDVLPADSSTTSSAALPGSFIGPMPFDEAPARVVSTAASHEAGSSVTGLYQPKNESATSVSTRVAMESPAGTIPDLSAAPKDTAPVRSATIRDVIFDIASVVLVAYGIGLTFAVGQLILGQIALARIVFAASPAPARVRERFEEACEIAGVKARLLLSNRVSSPVCFGLFSPTVVLPKSLAQTAYDNELMWVFAHELDHLRRGDQRLAWWVGLARALYFFVPPFWAVRKQLGLAQEYLADAAAARMGDAADYAQFLVNLSSAPIDRRVSRHPLTVTGVRAGRSDLYRRVNMLVNAAPETKRSRRWTRLAVGGTLGAAVLLSGFGFAADDNKPQKSKASATDVKDVVAEKVPAGADDQADKRAAEARAAADQARAEAQKAQAIAEQAARRAEKLAAEAANSAKAARVNDKVRTVTAQANDKQAAERKAEIDALKKEIAEAAKKGDLEAVNKAAERMAKLATSSQTRTMTVIAGDGQPARVLTVPGQPIPPRPPVPVMPPAAVWQMNPQVNQAMKAAHDEAMQQMKLAMEKLHNNPEAKAEMEKAMAEFQKAMEKAKKEMPQAIQQLKEMKLEGLPGQFHIEMIPGQALATGGGGEGRLGVQIAPIPADKVKENDLIKGVGVVVVNVVPDSAAAKAGIKSGDMIIELAGKPVPGEPQDVVKMIGKVSKDEKVNVIVVRDGKKTTIEGVKLPEAKAAKFKVLESIPGENLQFDFKPLQLDEKQLQEELKRVQKQIEELHNLKTVPGGKVEGKNVSMSVSVEDGVFKINADRDGVKYTITGSTESGADSIVIKDGDKTIKSKTVDGLPEKYRADVKKMMSGLKFSK